MASVEIARLITNLQLRLPGALANAMQTEMFVVMDKFFKSSNIWREDITFEVAGQDPPNTTYTITPAGSSLINKLLWIYDVTDTTVVSPPQVMGGMRIPGEIVLSLQPAENRVYQATVVLTVTDPTQRDGYVEFPDWILSKYRDVIEDGVLGRMMSQPNKPYTNLPLAQFHTRQFTSGVSTARVDAKTQNVYGAQTWRYPQTFAVYRQRRGGF